MIASYKPKSYNSLAPYLIVDNAKRLVDLLKTILGATELRRFDHQNGKIAHIELQLDDSILMLSDSTESYPANRTMLHIYVPDVFKTFDLAMKNGCKMIEKPMNREEDPDTRGAFYDFAGNYWAVSTQRENHIEPKGKDDLQAEIAEAFSNGKFEKTLKFLSDKIVWNIVGENTFVGKKAVLENCEQTSQYFDSVQTDFKTNEVISSENKVFVVGTAEFKRDGKRLAFISACDVYKFNQQNQIERIDSYCIPEKKG